jgi:uncharacterized protein (TIGR02246 family)
MLNLHIDHSFDAPWSKFNMIKVIRLPAILACLLLIVPAAMSAGPTDDEKALKKRADAFVEAFNKGDAASLAAFWTEDADYVDQVGRTTKGRNALEKTYAKLFAERKGAKLFISTTSMRMVKPDLAIEDGITEVIPADGGLPTSARYMAIHVKQEGQWLLATVRESAATPPSNYEQLQGVEWLAGDWEEEAEKGSTVRLSYSWAEHQNFLVATFATSIKDVPFTGGTQWIGWDAAAKQIRSWTFDNSGGFSHGVWSGDGNAWTISNSITTRDGKKIAATNILTKVDAEHATWQSTKRSTDGNPLPDTDIVKLKRVKLK